MQIASVVHEPRQGGGDVRMTSPARPEGAVVLCVDEKSGTQALAGSAPVSPQADQGATRLVMIGQPGQAIFSEPPTPLAHVIRVDLGS